MNLMSAPILSHGMCVSAHTYTDPHTADYNTANEIQTKRERSITYTIR